MVNRIAAQGANGEAGAEGRPRSGPRRLQGPRSFADPGAPKATASSAQPGFARGTLARGMEDVTVNAATARNERGRSG
jgi:hypothetical protein